MPSDPFSELFHTLQIAVLQEERGGSFRLQGQPPEWFEQLCPGAGPEQPCRPQDCMPFLEDFLIDATEAWEGDNPQRKSSGIWSERGRDQADIVLQATALLVGRSRILLIERLGVEFNEMQALLQKARGKTLENQRLLQTAEALKARASQADVLLESMPDIMFRVKRDGTYLGFGPGSAEPPVIRRVDEVLSPELSDEFMRHVEEALSAESVHVYEYESPTEGAPRNLEARMAVCGVDEVLVIVRDITERKRQEGQLAEHLLLIKSSRDDLLVILNQLRLGTALMDQEGRIRFLSRPAQRLFGIAQEEVLGKRWDEVRAMQSLDLEGIQQMSKLAPEKRSRVPVHWERLDGRQYWMEVDVQDDPGSTDRKIYFFYDVSEIHDLRRLLDEKGHFGDIVGKSKPMQRVFSLIRDLSQVDATVLIEGETGTGKELVARAIYSSSHRGRHPFLAVNCAGLTESLVASQLFGHRRGSFTGAISDQRGLFESADGGVLFLDEIGDIPPSVQTSLLRVLQEKEITRVGETAPRKVDVRIITATHRNLAEEVASGNFRADLLYRVRVARILLPTLRERLEDIPLLVTRFLGEIRAATGKRVQEISADAMRALMTYSWPGNVRELRSAIEFAAIRCTRTIIGPEDLPPELLDSELQARPNSSAPLSLQSEKERVIAALRRARGNRALAARMLGIGRATLYRKMDAFRINPKN